MNKPKKIAQAKNVKIICKKRKIPTQVDGEPWVVFGPCTIIIEKFHQARMLVNPMPSNTLLGLNVPEITVDDILKPFTSVSGFFENLVTKNNNTASGNTENTAPTESQNGTQIQPVQETTQAQEPQPSNSGMEADR